MKLKGILLISLAFFLPISIFVTDVLVFSIAIFWLVDGSISMKWKKIKGSKWMLSLLLLFAVYLLGMLWGTNHLNGSWILQKSAILLLLPILYSFDFSDKQIKNSLYAFVLSMTLSSVIALLINLKWIKRLFKYSDIFAKNWSNSVFIPYTDHNVFLAFTILLCLIYGLYLFKNKRQSIPLLIVVVVCMISLFTEKGRAGQIAFLLGTTMFLIFTFWNKKMWLAFSFISLISIVVLSYNFSSTFNERIHSSLNQTQQLDEENKNSLNTRYFLTKYTIDKLKERPVLGFGTGSFVQEFSSINEHATKILDGNKHRTPHNNYLFVWFELGLIGLLTFISIFYFQIKEIYKQPNGKFRIIMPVMFLIIMLFDTYFQNHNSAVLYAYLSFAFTYYSFK
ncbi:MAG: O-antigen ligase family protein [Flavobacteriales bacterium]|nr:O-antigen ligase family protein [Flavobacteriales bacterium]